MKHSDIIKEIYESNKDKLKSEQQVHLILLVTFRTFKGYLAKGLGFVSRNMFRVRPSLETWHMKLAEKIKYRKGTAERTVKWRSWHKKIIDKDFE